MESFVVELVVLLLAAFILGLAVGYVWWIAGWRRKVRTPSPSTVPAANAPEEEAALRARLQEAERQLERVQLKLKAARERSTRTPAPQREAAPKPAPAAATPPGPAPAPLKTPENEPDDRAAADAPAEGSDGPPEETAQPATAEPSGPAELPQSFAGSDDDPFATLTFHPADFAAADMTDSDTAPPLRRGTEGPSEPPEPTDEAAPGAATAPTADAQEADDVVEAAPPPVAQPEGVGGTTAGATIRIPREQLGSGAAGLHEVPVRRDDLTRIVGIGTATSRALRRAGLRSYERVAAASPDALRSALQDAGIAPGKHLDSWPEQARLLAAGDEEGLTDLRSRLTQDEAR